KSERSPRGASMETLDVSGRAGSLLHACDIRGALPRCRPSYRCSPRAYLRLPWRYSRLCPVRPNCEEPTRSWKRPMLGVDRTYSRDNQTTRQTRKTQTGHPGLSPSRIATRVVTVPLSDVGARAWNLPQCS